MSYYSIDAILAEEEILPIKTTVAYDNCAHLDASTQATGGPLDAGSDIEVPLWLALELAGAKYANIETSKSTLFSKTTLSLLAADPVRFNFAPERFHYFYQVGLRVAKATKNQGLADLLRSVFVKRFGSLVDNSQNLRGAPVSEAMHRLPSWELYLFRHGNQAYTALDTWRASVAHKIYPSPMASLLPKAESRAKRARAPTELSARETEEDEQQRQQQRGDGRRGSGGGGSSGRAAARLRRR
mmetsp:Transcript_6654/g.21540  ORF Transcript_6654/g.21540 Transcript_6654/m.21540 type:complete len:242 (+) Transcript_6654:54-779(+)